MSGSILARIADNLLNKPLLIHPDKATTILHVLEGRIGLGSVEPEAKPEASRFIGTIDRPDGKGRRRYSRASGRTALVTVDGSLVNRGAWVGASSGLTSYEGIAAQLDEIAADGDLDHLVIDMNSYGGEATGMFGLAAKIRNLRKRMHVVAVVNDVAASAGYGIASAADQIVISPTSIVGSIGVVMLHLDRSAEMAAKGIRPTLIHAGAKKVDGHPFGPLPDNVRADMQKDVMAFYDRFLETVEAGRGKSRLSAKKARETEADVFIGQEAIDAGLADRMGSLDDVLADLSRPVRATTSKRKGASMERDDLPNAGATETQIKAARLAGEADGEKVGIAKGEKLGEEKGAAAENARVFGILDLPEAQDRQSSAKALARNRAISIETAKGVLAGQAKDATAPAAPEAKPTPPTIAQRAAGQVEAGPASTDAAKPEAVKAGWGKAVAAINSRVA